MKAVVAALVLACLAVAYAGDGTVLVLTKQNFEETLASTPKILVEFYAPWCGHCKALAPEYDAAAQQLGEDGTLAKVDCTTEQDICSQHGVRGYPTLKFFTNGKASDYEGGRKASNIVSYVLKQSRPVVTELKSEEQVKTFTGKEEVVLVGFVDAAAEGRDVFTSLAEAHRNDFTVGIVSDAAVAKAFDVTSFPSAVLFRKFDEPQVKFTEELTEEALAAFVKSESFPVLGQLGPENYRQYIERGLPLVNIFTDPKSDADKKVVDAAREVAKTFKGKLSVVEIDGVAYQRHATSLGLSGKTPGIVIQDTNKHTKFLFDETAALTFEAATFRTFLQDFLDGKLTPFMKSAPIPEDNKGPLITVVGKTWNEIVIDNDKDVLVEFYAPWCGHCKELAPKYEQLAAQFANNKNVVIAKIDATENDAPNVEVQGFPTVYLFPKGDKTNPKQYQGDRTVEAMAKFVEINGNTFRTPGPGAASEHEL